MTDAPADTGEDRVALIAGDRVRTYHDLDRRTNALARVLRDLGADPLERVAVLLPSDVELIETGLASAKAATVLVPVNWHLKRDEIAWILSDSDAQVLVTDAAFLDEAGAALEQAPGCALLVVGEGGGRDYERLLAAASDSPLDSDGFGGPEYFFYTSGTTGRPRGVERPPPQVGQPPAALAVAAMWGLTADDVYLACSPLYHATSAYAFTYLLLGGIVVVLPRWDAREWLRLVERHHVTTTFMTPAHFIRVLEVPENERRRYDTSSLRLILHAAAPCPVPVKHRMIDAFPSAAIWEFYGASEGGATRISPEEWLAHPGSVGRPWPGTEVEIRDDEGELVAAGERGRVYIRPPAAAARFRYHRDDEKTAQAWQADAFTVGDVGYLDEDGYLFVTDRSSDMILRGGVNVYPAEIEQCLYTHPAVVDCAVLGVPDERYGEAILALVEARRPVTADELARHCGEHLAGFKCPQTFEVVAELPRDPNGKVLKRLLREAHGAGDQ